MMFNTKITVRFILSIITVSLLAGCVVLGFDPGHGAKPQAGFRAADPILAALISYHQSRGRYPTTLEELVPNFLPGIQSLSFVYHGESHRFKYQREPGDSFGLQFVYLNHSGILESIDECDYHAKGRQWECHRIDTQF